MVGRIVVAIFGLFLLALATFAVYWGLDVLADGQASVSIGRRSRARVGLTGWTAYLYGLGILAGAAWFGLSACGLLLMTWTRRPLLGWRLLAWGRWFMIAAAMCCTIAVIAKVF
jgi:hypothetical protein